ncbi:MAG: Stp1/IreP family PP2C-type Ser/Thr phosphatase [Clostridiaceae bacterium]|mgnify:CR=1 FL=1|nr:Stp1/IreP family PP2C-type Ser/Thr phosphatase [Clostridiaceae bacterium]
MRFAFESDKGKIREKNEDSYKVISGVPGVPDTFIVADGMGGHNKGEVASKTAVEFSEEFLMKNTGMFAQEQSILSGIISLIDETNRVVYMKSKETEENAGMGTTFIISVLLNGKFFIGHVGDSRVYLIRDGNIEQLTVDHSYIEELVRNGTLSREEAENHPNRNIITRALGCADDILADTLSIETKQGDTFVLCTDGLSNMLTDERILDIISASDDPGLSCSELVLQANENGGEDNITVIVVKL